MVINHDDADDVLQEVFIKVWTNLDSFRGESAAYTWMYRIAMNQCLEFLRKQKKRQRAGDPEWEARVLDQLETDPYFDGDQAEKTLQEAILTLPEKQRTVFQLKYYDTMKYEDMSTVLGTSVGALKASYHHAVKKIEAYVNQSLNPGLSITSETKKP